MRSCGAWANPPCSTFSLAGLADETPVCGGMYSVYTKTLIQDIAHTDLVVIPAVDGDIRQVLEANRAFMPWIIERA